VIGHSSGAPHALACAARIGERLTRVVVVGCGAPWELPELARGMDFQRRALRGLALHAPWLLRLICRTLPDPRSRPEKFVRTLLGKLPAPDRELLARPEILELALAHTVTAVEHGLHGMVAEVLLLARPWGFALDAVSVPVTLWCGEQDTAAPLEQARHLAAHLPRAELRPLAGAGHLCVISHWSAILRSALDDGA
jgi:pimeloyl-ACP methyl ester carboxylesterase